jgi:hypothetical protein
MNKYTKDRKIEDNNLQLKAAHGFDDCIIGVGERCGHPSAFVYDGSKIIRKLMKQGMDKEEAREFFEFNILGAWVGDTTPIFIMN